MGGISMWGGSHYLLLWDTDWQRLFYCKAVKWNEASLSRNRRLRGDAQLTRLRIRTNKYPIMFHRRIHQFTSKANHYTLSLSSLLSIPPPR